MKMLFFSSIFLNKTSTWISVNFYSSFIKEICQPSLNDLLAATKFNEGSIYIFQKLLNKNMADLTKIGCKKWNIQWIFRITKQKVSWEFFEQLLEICPLALYHTRTFLNRKLTPENEKENWKHEIATKYLETWKKLRHLRHIIHFLFFMNSSRSRQIPRHICESKQIHKAGLGFYSEALISAF